LAKTAEAERRLASLPHGFIPPDEIPAGDETTRLHRWGYRRYKEMFNARQLLGLELSCQAISQVKDERTRNALATNLSDLLRYQNMLCRYDAKVLKSLDIFSVHGFPVGLIQCESNLLGIADAKGTPVGSGGWENVISKFTKAKSYCDRPFEIRRERSQKCVVYIDGEWIGDVHNGNDRYPRRAVQLRCEDSASAEVAPASLDAVLTDPPYFGNVQYAELMDFCYVWLRTLINGSESAFSKRTTRDQQELTGNATLERGLEDFAEGLSRVFCKMASALKPGRPLAFTYHHNNLEAYAPVALAILDSGLSCTAAIPCPAEMSASIHISGTKSSIVDTVFVCRGTSTTTSTNYTLAALVRAVRRDLDELAEGGLNASGGDTLCVINGNLTKLAIAKLRKSWDKTRPVADRLRKTSKCLASLPDPGDVLGVLNNKAESRRASEPSGISGD